MKESFISHGNIKQKEFYNSIFLAEKKSCLSGYCYNKKANFVTRFWAFLRDRQQQALKLAGVENKILQKHKDWFQKRIGGSFLEIGCFTGSPSTMELIRFSSKYLGIELSDLAVDHLNEKFFELGLKDKANAKSIDFLLLPSDVKYDVIYAHGVLHHFKDPDLVFRKLRQILAKNGLLVFVEPSEVNFLYKFLRMFYRLFQSDSDWEWPFNKNTVASLERYFFIKDGFGWGRWSLLPSIFVCLPILDLIFKPFYNYLTDIETSKRWDKKTWYNSMITACCEHNF